MLKNWKKTLQRCSGDIKIMLFVGSDFFCCTQGKRLSFSPCTLFSKSFSLAEAVASGMLPDTHNFFDFSGALPNLALLRAEMWLVQLPLTSLEPKASLLFWLHRTTPISQLLIFWYFFWVLQSLFALTWAISQKKVDILASESLCFPIIT